MRAVSTIVRKELGREARRARTFVVRTLTILLLFSIVWFTFLDVTGSLRYSGQAGVGLQMFSWFAYVQLAMLFLIGPALALVALRSETESGTLPLLLLTGLSPWQIVRGMLLARALVLGSLIVVGLPVIALSLFYGGISILQVVSVLALNASLGLLFCATGLYYSTTNQRLAAASGWCYGGLVFKIFIVPLLVFALHPFVAIHLAIAEGTVWPAWVDVVLALWLTRSAVRRSVVKVACRETLGGPPPRLRATTGRHQAAEGAGGGLGRQKWWQKTTTWRLLHSRGGGAAVAWVLALVLGLGYLAVVAALSRHLAGGVLLHVQFFCLVALTAFPAAVAISGEREAGMLDLLLLSKLSPARIMWRKFLGVQKYALPVLAVMLVQILAETAAPEHVARIACLLPIEVATSYLLVIAALFYVSARMARRSQAGVLSMVVASAILFGPLLLIGMLRGCEPLHVSVQHFSTFYNFSAIPGEADFHPIYWALSRLIVVGLIALFLSATLRCFEDRAVR